MNTEPIIGAVAALSMLLPGSAAAQDQDQAERQVTLVGCVMRESQYRDMYGPGRSGPRGPGLGGRDEYMLVDAREMTAADASARNADAPCPAAPGTFPTAYELTGSREGDLGAFLGRRVVLTGIQKGAEVRPVASGELLRPTGGFDPLGHELHLFEVEVASFREPAPARAAAPEIVTPVPPAREEPAAEAAPPAPEPAIAAAPEPAPAQPEPAPAPAVTPEPQPEPVAQLPRTAGPLPLAGLAGLLSLAAAAGLRGYRRHTQRRSATKGA
jgi:hypothetical protein